MTVSIRMYGVELPPERNAGEIDLPEGTTIAGSLDAIRERFSLSISAKNLRDSAFLVNRMGASASAVLADGDELLILRTMKGG